MLNCGQRNELNSERLLDAAPDEIAELLLRAQLIVARLIHCDGAQSTKVSASIPLERRKKFPLQGKIRTRASCNFEAMARALTNVSEDQSSRAQRDRVRAKLEIQLCVETQSVNDLNKLATGESE